MKKIIFILFTLISLTGFSQFSEDFESGVPGTLTQVYESSSHLNWHACSSNVETGGVSCPINGNQSAVFYNGSYTAYSTSLVTPSLDLSNGNYRLSFKHSQPNWGGDQNTLEVLYSTDNGSNWNSLVNYTNDIPQVLQEFIDLPVGLSATTQIKFKATNHYGYAIILDDIKITQIQDYDIKLQSLNLTDVMQQGNVNIGGEVKNFGNNDITSFDLHWTVDGSADTHTETININLAPGAIYSFTHSTPWNASVGNHIINVYIDNLNGNITDQDPNNNSLTKNILIVNEVFPKNVVYEEGTGTWCGWCVRGIVGLKNMSHYHPDGSWIGIAVHHGSSSTADPMQTTDGYSNFVASRVSGFPSGILDRKNSEIDPGYQSLEAAYQNEITKTPLAKVNFSNVQWNSSTREISADVSVTFAMDLTNVNYKIGLIIVEDGVTGTTSGYAQHNYYSNQYDLVDWEGINYRNLPSTIPASQMVYNHVGRAAVEGVNGVSGVIPSNVTYNTPYTHTFTYTLPADYNENNIKLVGLAINENGEIENGKEVELDATNSIDDILERLNVHIYPNPASDYIFIDNGNDVNLKLFNIAGIEVLSTKLNKSHVALPVNNLDKGIYFIQIAKKDITATKKIIIK